MKTSEEKRQFILNQLRPYKNQPENLGWDKEKKECVYYDKETGNMCAIGKNLRDPENYGDYVGTLDDLLEEHEITLKEALTHEAWGAKLKKETWRKMQNYHDFICCGYSVSKINAVVSSIEKLEGVRLYELKM